jgi:hypothetical protein
MQGFEFTVQAALGLLNLSAVVLSAFAVGKKISLLASSDQKALPSCGLPKPFTLFLFVLTPSFVFHSLICKKPLSVFGQWLL